MRVSVELTHVRELYLSEIRKSLEIGRRRPTALDGDRAIAVQPDRDGSRHAVRRRIGRVTGNFGSRGVE